MKRRTHPRESRVARSLLISLVTLTASGLVVVACRGGGSVDGADASFDGEAARQAPGSATIREGGCAEDEATTESATDGGADCGTVEE
jgi:hypothetical protein